MEKIKLVNFIAKIMEQSGFKVYKNFQTSRHIIDIYGVLPSILGDVGVVVAVKNYDEGWEVGLDVLKEMEMVAKTLKASKIVVVSSSYFTDNAVNYAGRRNIKLLDKDDLVNLAKKFSNRSFEEAEEYEDEDVDVTTDEEYIPSSKSGGLSFFSGSRKSLSKSGKSPKANRPIGPILTKILSNTISLIIIVVLVSFLISYLVRITNENTALIGISTILTSAILSYGLALFFERDFMATLVKGTTVFFVSLIVYVILILVF